MSSSSSSTNYPSITATYTNLTTESTHTLTSSPLPAPSDETTQRTAYLGKLQEETRAIQEEINAFLTQKMESEKEKGEDGGGKEEVEDRYGEVGEDDEEEEG
jgi:hypothetical protein